jgi:hypothetical protein
MEPKKISKQLKELLTLQEKLQRRYASAALKEMKNKVVVVPKCTRIYVGRKARIDSVDTVEVKNKKVTVFFDAPLIKADGTDSSISVVICYPPRCQPKLKVVS